MKSSQDTVSGKRKMNKPSSFSTKCTMYREEMVFSSWEGGGN